MITNEQAAYYSQSLSTWISNTIAAPDHNNIAAIRSLWDDESWENIVSRFQTEGSTWIVWWGDGVREYAGKDQEDLEPETIRN